MTPSIPLDRKLLPVTVKSINQGKLHRKTTVHDPLDMRRENAGWIHALVRTKAGKTQGAGDWHDVVSWCDQEASSPGLSGRILPSESRQE
jgi:hypothetical protein